MTVDDLRKRTVVTVPEAGRIMGFKSNSAAYRASNPGGAMPGVRHVGGKKVVSAPVLLAWLLGTDDDEASNVTQLRNAG